jgi:protoporphyrinogen oxidase
VSAEVRSRQADVVVIGAGLSGLAAALTAQRAGLEVTVLEAENEPGGLARSVRVDGYTFDYSGHLLHLARPETRELVFEVSAKEDWQRLSRRSAILFAGDFVPYPFQLHLAFAPESVRLECVEGLPVEEPQLDDDPAAVGFGDWIAATLGPGIAKHFMVPYNEKLSTVGVDELTCEWLGRFVPRPALAEIREGATTRRRVDAGYNATFLYPRAGGIDGMSSAMAAKVSDLRLGARVGSIDTERRCVRLEGGEELRYRAGVVSSAPLPRMAELVSPALAGADGAKRLRATAVTCVNIGARAIDERFESLQWVYLPEPRFTAYRVGFYRRFSEAMAPPGREAVYVEISHSGELGPEQAVDAAVADLVAAGVLESEDEVEVAVPLEMPTAYVIHDRFASEARRVLLGALEQRGVQMAGRYGRWEYAAMEDALWQGIEAAERICRGAAVEA